MNSKTSLNHHRIEMLPVVISQIQRGQAEPDYVREFLGRVGATLDKETQKYQEKRERQISVSLARGFRRDLAHYFELEQRQWKHLRGSLKFLQRFLDERNKYLLHRSLREFEQAERCYKQKIASRLRLDTGICDQLQNVA